VKNISGIKFKIANQFANFSFAYAWQVLAIFIILSYPGSSANDHLKIISPASATVPRVTFPELISNLHKLSEARVLMLSLK
jgi:hypothetical protein